MERAEAMAERLERVNELRRQATRDAKLALRGLWRSPGFTLIAVAALALGIGANTAIFSLVQAVLLQPLPYPEPQQLMQVTRENRGGGQRFVSVPNFLDERQETGVFANLAAYDDSSFNLSGGGTIPQRVAGEYVTANFLATLGMAPATGANFGPEETDAGGPREALISQQLWRTRYSGDPGIVGRTVTINAEPTVIVGVLPARFRFPNVPDVLEPLHARTMSSDRAANLISTIGRLRPGMPLATAEQAMRALSTRLNQAYPHEEQGQTIGLHPLREEWTGNLRPVLLLLFGAVGLVLLIACADLANLLLARAGGRQKEMAVRLALGARRARIVGQLLTESVLLAVAGAAAGVGVAYLALPAIVALAPGYTQFSGAAALRGRLNLPVLLFTLGVAVVTGVVFGLAPALQAAQADVNATLQQESGRASSGTAHRLRRALVVAEIALTLPLLLGAGLLLENFARTRAIDPGFKADHVLTAHMMLSLGRYHDGADVGGFNRAVLDKVRALPGVKAAGITLVLPFSMCPDFPTAIPGRSFSLKDAPDFEWHPATSQTFAALGVPVLSGRGLRDSDTATSQPVVVINREAAREYWPNESPIGHSLWVGKEYMAPGFTDTAPRTIVGVVGDVRQNGPQYLPAPAIYVPMSQLSAGFMRVFAILPVSLVARTEAAPMGLGSAVEQAVWSVDSSQAVSDVKPLTTVAAEAMGPERFNLTLVGLFAGLALLLAALGLYGVMSHAVAERTREMGVRMAIGAAPGRLIWMVLAEGLRWTAAGLVLGGVAAWGLTRVLAHQFSALQQVTWASGVGAAGVLVGVALLACLAPALRAARMDPLEALRHG